MGSSLTTNEAPKAANVYKVEYQTLNTHTQTHNIVLNFIPVIDDNKNSVWFQLSPPPVKAFEPMFDELGQDDLVVVESVSVLSIYNPYPPKLTMTIKNLVRNPINKSAILEIDMTCRTTERVVFSHTSKDMLRKTIGTTEKILQNKIQKDPTDDEFEYIPKESWLFGFLKQNLAILDLKEADLACTFVFRQDTKQQTDMVRVKSVCLEKARDFVKKNILDNIMYLSSDKIEIAIKGESDDATELLDQVRATKHVTNHAINIGICLRIDFVVGRRSGVMDLNLVNTLL